MSPEKIIITLQNQGIKLEPKLKFKAKTPLSTEQEELLQTHKELLLCHLVGRESIPRLPFKLERLVSAATSKQLHMSIRGITDLNAYVMAWACVYLVGDRKEALKRLEEILEYQGKVLN